MLATLIGPIMAIITRIIPDREKQAEAKAEMMDIMVRAQAEEMKAKSAVVIAEVKGESWMQRNWRPVLMFTFIFIFINNFILAPYLVAFGLPIVVLPIPDEMMYMIGLGMSGYIGGRSYEKSNRDKQETKRLLYNVLRERSEGGFLKQDLVDEIEKVLN